ncbi:Uncharacterized protein Adt_18129 [Abeliophyllum distichum]|uniref:Uncharacterized protein n=1 Tax=Abeliophyllum distichum TaxID=126358 RepID=A0ABD1TIP1_9LAMI
MGNEEKVGQHCDYCNMNGHTRSTCFKMNGHTKSTCFKIHEYPDWYKNLKEQKAKISNQNGRAMANMADTPLDLDEERHHIKDKTISQTTSMLDLIQQELVKFMKGKMHLENSNHVNFAHLRRFCR